MIKLAGHTEQTFIFPARISDAFAYYAQLEHIFRLLPHISLQEIYSANRFRMLYSTIELGLYRVRMFCDIEATLDETDKVLHIQPLDGKPPVKAHADLHSLTGQGFYASKSVFKPLREQTEITYSLALWADLPIPLAARLIPRPVLNSLARSISNHRIHEIAQGFINYSVADFQNPLH